jgi:amino acid transporter
MSLPEPDRRQLTLLDATCIMLGIVVGSGIFRTPADVAAHCPNSVVLIGVWLAGGIVSLMGALCFAELSTRYPEHGGTYAFLNRAYGSWAGLLFAWTDFWIVRPANAGAVAIVLGNYANAALPWPYFGAAGYAVAAVLLATASHLVGLRTSRWSQNALSLAKIAGLLLIVAVAVVMPAGLGESSSPATLLATSPARLATAFVLVMFCYGGWSDLSNVAAEVRDPSRNLLRSLVLGVAAIAGTYVAINAAAVYSLGLQGLVQSPAFAAEMLGSVGPMGERLVALLVIVCCFGSLSGVVFTGARVYHALGLRHALFAWLSGWDVRRGTPPQSLAAQAAISCLLLLVAGRDERGFERLVVFAGPCYWGFVMLAALAVIVLRQRDRRTPAPFRVPFYPALPLAFAAICGALVWGAVDFIHQSGVAVEVWYSVIVVAAGIALALWTRQPDASG